MRSQDGLRVGIGLCVIVALWTTGSSAAGANAGDATEAIRPDLAFCRGNAQAGRQCSFATLETPFTCSEAAGVIATYYQEFPDERYYTSSERLLLAPGGSGPN